MAALSLHSMACKLYNMGLSHAWNFQSNLSVDNITATTFVFFHVLRESSNVEIQLFWLWFYIIHILL